MDDLKRVCSRAFVLFLLAALMVCCITPPAYALASVALRWDPNTEPDLAGYTVHYGTTVSRAYTTHLDVGNTVSRTITGLADSTKYYFAVTARDTFGSESGYSNEVILTTPAASETVSAPARPTGPATGVTGVAYTYTASGAVSSTGDPVQYRFSWADGSVSAWLAVGVTSASKTWSAAGTYSVLVEARCSLHTSILSATSPSVAVTISSGAVESVSVPTAPAGPAGGVTDDLYVFSTGGSVSSTGDPVVYRFHWGDGTSSEWVGPGQPVTAGKSWAVPGTYQVQTEAACASHPTGGSFSPAVNVSIVQGSAAPSYVLWTNSYTGQAALWKIDLSLAAGSPLIIPNVDAAWLQSATGVGAGWQATSYQHVGPNEGYVLWTNGDTGQAALWKIDPSQTAGSASVTPLVDASWVQSATGVGAGWEATSYYHVGPNEGYILWTNGDTGQAGLWKIDPSQAVGSSSIIPQVSSFWVQSETGVGAGWQATSYQHVGPNEGYVLWTNGDTGQAGLWRIDPSPAAGSSTIMQTGAFWMQTVTGVGAGWQATSYQNAGTNKNYLLWTNGATGQAALWKLSTSLAPGSQSIIPLIDASWLHSASGVGAPWKATSFAR